MESTLVGFLYGVAGMLIGGLATHFLNKDIVKRAEFNKAAAEFKAAFIPELRYLDYRYSPERPPEIGIYKTLSVAFDRHEIAVIKFRPHLGRQQCVDFDKAWENYCNKDNGKPHFIVYAEPDGVTDKIKKQKFYLKKMNTLLRFAEPEH